MARGHADLPTRVAAVTLAKRDIYAALIRIDSDEMARNRVLKMEIDFRTKIDTHLRGLPAAGASFQKFNTSPFVLMFHSRRQNYHHVSEVEKDIIPAKVFSSMETSAGRMVEEVVLPAYGWQVVPSQMHTSESVLDGRKTKSDDFLAVTLKSGPRCLNDEMAQSIGRDVAHHVASWADIHGTRTVDFTYGVLYGTPKQSNKKDWHILRSIDEVLPHDTERLTSHKGGWSIAYRTNGLQVTATVRVGLAWWTYLGGPDAWLEVCLALVRACIAPSAMHRDDPTYVISDLAQILDISTAPSGFNVSLIQASQLEWVLFFARHLADDLTD